MFYFRFENEFNSNKPKGFSPLEARNEDHAMEIAKDNARRAHQGIKEAYYYDSEKFPLRDAIAVVYDSNKEELGRVTVTGTGHILHDLATI